MNDDIALSSGLKGQLDALITRFSDDVARQFILAYVETFRAKDAVSLKTYLLEQVGSATFANAEVKEQVIKFIDANFDTLAQQVIDGPDGVAIAYDCNGKSKIVTRDEHNMVNSTIKESFENGTSSDVTAEVLSQADAKLAEIFKAEGINVYVISDLSRYDTWNISHVGRSRKNIYLSPEMMAFVQGLEPAVWQQFWMHELYHIQYPEKSEKEALAAVPVKDVLNAFKATTINITPEQIDENIVEAAKVFALNDIDAGYLKVMYTQYLNRRKGIKDPLKTALRMTTDPKSDPKDVLNAWNFLVTALLTEQERAEYLQSKKYGDLKEQRFLDASGKTIVTVSSLDGGIGESLGRLEFKKMIARALGRSDAEVTLSAKGLDLGFLVEVNGKAEFISVAEAKLMQLVMAKEQGVFADVEFQALVNWQSKISYETLLYETTCYYDRIGDGMRSRTYAQLLNDAGIVILPMVQQADLPGLNAATWQVATDKNANAQPGGHGQFGFLFLSETYNQKMGLTNKPNAQAHVQFFCNGDNLNSRPDPYITGYMVENNLPIIKITTTATPIDEKGGKDGVERYVLSDGTVIYIPTQMEVADAKSAGQEKDFYRAGQEGGLGQAGAQAFNTNIFYINKLVLHDILNEVVKQGILTKFELDQLFAPTLIDKPAKVAKDGKEYIPIDGAIGLSMHNLNKWFMINYHEDQRVRNILGKYGIDRLLYFVDIPRTEFFTPQKKAYDPWMLLGYTDYYEFDAENNILKDAEDDLVPPQLVFEDSGKYWEELQNYINAFGEKSYVKELKGLKVKGKIQLRNAKYVGYVDIINNTDMTVDLMTMPELQQFIVNGQMILENIRIVISESGKVKVLKIENKEDYEKTIGDRLTLTGEKLSSENANNVKTFIRGAFARKEAQQIESVEGIDIYIIPGLEAFDDILSVHEGFGGEAMDPIAGELYLSPTRAKWINNLQSAEKTIYMAHAVEHVKNPDLSEREILSRRSLDNINFAKATYDMSVAMVEENKAQIEAFLMNMGNSISENDRTRAMQLVDAHLVLWLSNPVTGQISPLVRPITAAQVLKIVNAEKVIGEIVVSGNTLKYHNGQDVVIAADNENVIRVLGKQDNVVVETYSVAMGTKIEMDDLLAGKEVVVIAEKGVTLVVDEDGKTIENLREGDMTVVSVKKGYSIVAPENDVVSHVVFEVEKDEQKVFDAFNALTSETSQNAFNDIKAKKEGRKEIMLHVANNMHVGNNFSEEKKILSLISGGTVSMRQYADLSDLSQSSFDPKYEHVVIAYGEDLEDLNVNKKDAKAEEDRLRVKTLLETMKIMPVQKPAEKDLREKGVFFIREIESAAVVLANTKEITDDSGILLLNIMQQLVQIGTEITRADLVMLLGLEGQTFSNRLGILLSKLLIPPQPITGTLDTLIRTRRQILWSA
ncbi:MAG: UTP--glucose-1-phosphate uridylyltransferase [Candidatus Omnitrophica bacterium]|nr:UTP--glucose-1-phosphate uridylyltransferase [Candidatus Omnitrophota bacterium]